MGSKTRQIAVGTELDENNANLVTSRKIKTRLARPIVSPYLRMCELLMIERPIFHGEA